MNTPTRVTVVTIAGHLQPAGSDCQDFQTWRALCQHLGSARCVWAGPPLLFREGSLDVRRRRRHQGARSLLWVAGAVRDGIRRSRAAIRDGETVVINGAEHWGWLAAWIVARTVRRPWLMELHGDYLALPAATYGRARKVMLERAAMFFARRADARRVVARSVQDAFARRGISSDLLPPRLLPVWQQPVDRERPPLSGPVLSLLTVGRLHRQKGYDILLDAMAELIRQRPDARLRIVGDGPEMANLASQSARLGLSHAVTFVGAADATAVREELARADIFVISSRDEGLPRTLLEAAAAGVPVVATAVSGIPAAAAGWPTVRLAPVDAAALAEGVRQMVAHPPTPGQLAAVRQDAVGTYGFDRNIAALAGLYRRVAVSRGVRA